MTQEKPNPLTVFLVAGEASGDALGARLMAALQAARPIHPLGVGGPLMAEAGLESLFPLSDIAVMGLVPVLRRLPLLIKRINQTVAAALAANPDVLVLIDAPDFTHRVARKLRKARPHLLIIDYVSPSIWAWRPGRAKAMRAYTNHVLTLLPFEPAAHQRLGGPEASYVGHPLIERLASLRPGPDEARGAESPAILILPGSRAAEIRHLLGLFGEAAGEIARAMPQARFVLPAVPHLVAGIRAGIASWPVPVEIIEGEAAKLDAFRAARVALAASGTVSLELALAGVPMVIAYRGSAIEAAIARRLVLVPSIVLPNLILDENLVPEFIQEHCVPARLAEAVLTLIPDGPARAGQLSGFARMEGLMAVPGGNPSDVAAQRILDLVSR